MNYGKPHLSPTSHLEINSNKKRKLKNNLISNGVITNQMSGSTSRLRMLRSKRWGLKVPQNIKKMLGRFPLSTFFCAIMIIWNVISKVCFSFYRTVLFFRKRNQIYEEPSSFSAPLWSFKMWSSKCVLVLGVLLVDASRDKLANREWLWSFNFRSFKIWSVCYFWVRFLSMGFILIEGRIFKQRIIMII